MATGFLLARAETPKPGVPRLTAEIDASSSVLRVVFEGRPVVTYAFGRERFKPCVIQLATLEGVPVVRDAPPDHPHHHGLMYAAKVDGLNFWEEHGDAIGRQVSEATPAWIRERARDGSERILIRHRLRWEAPGERRVLLDEDRRLEVTANPSRGELALEWVTRLEPTRRTGKVRLEGSDYNGLGLRLPEGFDRVAAFVNADGLAYSEAQARDVTETSWTAVTGSSSGHDVMIALAGPRPRNGASAFFTMRQPFAYLAATQRLDRQPRDLEPGRPMELRHLLLVLSRPLDRDALGARFLAWGH